jgi:hypothetical protein
LNYRQAFLRPEELPVPLKRLAPYQIEDFLCIYRERLNSKWYRLA